MRVNMPERGEREAFARKRVYAVVGMCAATVIVGAGIASRRRSLLYRRRLDQIRGQRFDEREKNIKTMREKLLSKQPMSENTQKNILSLSATELIEEIRMKRFNAVDVLETYQRRALEIHDKTNCLIEFFPEADDWAKNVDNENHRVGLLFGLPVSLKDDIAVKGKDTTMGCVELIGGKCEHDSVFVEALKKQKAIPFVRTNIPQMCMAYECSNPIYGTTVNPFDSTRIPGGSSGGESALIASGGSLLGFGSDLAGSIRLPAAFTGICGFKPTPERVSKKGLELVPADYSEITSVWGPLAKNMDSLILGMKTLWEGHMVERDPSMVPLNFRTKVFEDKTPLRIGYIYDLGMIPPTFPMKRGVNIARDVLISKQHQLVPMEIPDIQTTVELEFKTLFADGGKEVSQILKHDKIDPCVDFISELFLTPKWLKHLKAYWYRYTSTFLKYQDPEIGMLYKTSCGMNSVVEYWSTVAKIQEFSQNVSDKMAEKNLDAFILPPFPYVAPPINGFPKFWKGKEYQMFPNVLGWPAGVVPVTNVQENDEKDYPEHDSTHRNIKRVMENSVGLPVGVQVVCKKWDDETCLRIMNDIEVGLVKENRDHSDN